MDMHPRELIIFWRNLQGKVVSAPPGRARVILCHFLVGGGDLEGGSG